MMRDTAYFTRSFIVHSSLITHHSSLAIIALGLVLAAASQQTARAQYPVRWTRAVGPPTRQALEAKFREPVKLPRSERIYDHEREIRSCVDYARASKDDLELGDADKMRTARLFDDRCGIIALVLTAKPARTSYIKSFKLDEAALDLFPPTLSSELLEDGKAAGQAERQGLSWKKFRPGLKILEKSENGIAVLEPEPRPEQTPGEKGTPDEDPTPNDVRVYLEIKAFGDFNGDGIEDVLLFRADHFVYHSLFSWSALILTRLEAGGPLKAIELEDGEIEKAMARASQARTATPAKAGSPK